MVNVKIKDIIKDKVLLIDGAMGTYYASLENDYINSSEKANIINPNIIKKIHNEYIRAGAMLIRTNTFLANRFDMNCDIEEANQILTKGYEIAYNCAKKKNVLVACSIGPISENNEITELQILEEYFRIINLFMRLGGKIFIFESFSQIDYLEEIIKYINNKDKDIEIITLFSINGQGYTKNGISQKKLVEEIKNIKGLTAFGFNCGVGAGHLYNNLKSVDLNNQNFAAIPNAGYPEILYERTKYLDNADYFADKMIEMCKLGVKIIGGCCGTTPVHIKKISNKLKDFLPITITKQESNNETNIVIKKQKNNYWDKMEEGKFVVAVEIDPPSGYDTTRLMEAAHYLKGKKVDIITIADSPLGKMRLDSIMMSTKIYKEVGIEVMPHVCCRDKNILSINALISAAYVEGLRNFLFVTGDPLPVATRNEIKSVFNMNSVKLMEFAQGMNEKIEGFDSFIYGGALNYRGENIDRIIERAIQKKAAGAKFLLTQPIYNEEDLERVKLIKEKSGIKILGGVLPLVSYNNARFINNEFAGITIPNEIINIFDPQMSREEAETIGIEISVKIARLIKDNLDGLYLMTPFNRAAMIGKILKQLN